MAGWKPSIFALAGAVVMTAGIAHAQEASVAPSAAARAETPWYDRFTVSHGPTETMTGLGPSDRAPQTAWNLSRRWGVTVDVTQAERAQTEGAAPANGDERTVGAFYQFTPGMRVGGALSVREADRAPLSPNDPAEPVAGVRIESAFRF